jgi:hypothetical protein
VRQTHGHPEQGLQPVPELAGTLDGLTEVKRRPGALRLRATIDKGWRPGLWLARDHAAAAEPKPESPLPAESTAAVTEFA